MFEANSSLMMLLMAGFFGAALRWPAQPLRVRLVVCSFALLCLVANWVWTIRLPIGRDLGFAIDMMSALLLIAVIILTLRKGSYPEAAPKR